MKKTGLIALLLPTVILSSCDLTVFDYWIDEDCGLRVVRYSDKDKTVAVDEYYYHGDKYDGESTINITIPESIEVDGERLKARALGDGLFADNANLKRVVIPGSVTSIGASALASCPSLSSIYIPGNVAIIGEYVFDQNTSLTIYCEASSAIEGWDENWNDENCSVVWGCTYQEYLEAIA